LASKKKRERLSEGGAAARPCSATDAALLHAALGFVTRGLKHDGRRAAPIAEIHELEAPLLARLGWPHAEGTLAVAVRARAEPALLDAVGQLVLVLGVDGCKRLHYELCVATRSETTRRKLAAVRGLARLYSALKESAPAHIPEAVPFVAELVEDGELEVRQEALALMRSLEQLTGEELMH
jgi:U3 small nucleolar RNA-associated protein 10